MKQLIFDAMEAEHKRQNEHLELIASENIVSTDVLRAAGSIFTNKYAEGYSGRRYYGGCEHVDVVENLAIDYAKALFACKYANVQTHSGSQANQAVFMALLQPGDTILGMDLSCGGHLTHGHKASLSGKWFDAQHYGVDKNGFLDYEDLKQKLYTHRPRLLIAGASAYSRIIDFERIRRIIYEYNIDLYLTIEPSAIMEEVYESKKCMFMVDMAHIAGLVAVGLHPTPIGVADVVTSTTHKTLRGPRGGLILTNDEAIAKKIDSAVFPGIQGGPLMHIIAAKAMAFAEALEPSYADYMRAVHKNAQIMAESFEGDGIKMVTGGTDNHLILLDLSDYKFTGKDLETALEQVSIVVNKNAIPNDPRPPSQTSGIRIGTPALTTRGLSEAEFKTVANLIFEVIDRLEHDEFDDTVQNDISSIVSLIARQHPIYASAEG